MGCDIHLHVEMKFKDKWVPVERQFTVPTDRGVEYRPLPWWGGRSYRAFAMMAGVRNYHGIEPISEPRGLPTDLSTAVEEDAEHWGSDGHSRSYLTLQELMNLGDYWEKTVTVTGIVHGIDSIKDLIVSREGQDVLLSDWPPSFSQAILGPPPEELFNIRVVKTYRDCAGELPKLIERITEVAEQYGLFSVGDKYAMIGKEEMDHWVDVSDRIRIVFWFDN